MSSIEMAVRNARAIETLLVERLGASGKGLHEKISSVEQRLPVHIIKTARWIATLRNSAVHQHDFEIGNPEDFMNAASRVISFLEAMPVNAASAALATRTAADAGPGLRLEPIRRPGPEQHALRQRAELRAPRPRRPRVARPRSRWKALWLLTILVVGLLATVLQKTEIGRRLGIGAVDPRAVMTVGNIV